MEDKWLVHTDKNWLIFRRSWTGFAIFGLLFERTDSGSKVVNAWVSRNRSQHGGTDAEYEKQLLLYLVSTHLLNRPAEFPMPRELGPGIDPLFQHHIVGRN